MTLVSSGVTAVLSALVLGVTGCGEGAVEDAGGPAATSAGETSPADMPSAAVAGGASAAPATTVKDPPFGGKVVQLVNDEDEPDDAE